MQALVIVFPGSNCDRDVAVALTQLTGRAPTMVWHRETDLPPADLIVLPGGFSYGDYLRCGAMAAQSPVMRAVADRAGAGVPVLGICNGFQMLCELGLLPGVLMRNGTLQFVSRKVALRVERTDGVFLGGYRRGDILRIPVAHMDGNYFADAETLARLEDGGQVAFRYVDEPDMRPAAGTAASLGGWAGNPNGAQRDIAGITNATGTVLGLMPHPERAIDAAHGSIDGRALFAGFAAALAA